MLPVDPTGSGGEVMQKLQLSSLSIHSPRSGGTLSTFPGQFKARAEKSRRLHTPPRSLWHKPSRAAPLPVSAGSSGPLATDRGPLNLPPCMQKVQPFVEGNRGSQTLRKAPHLGPGMFSVNLVTLAESCDPNLLTASRCRAHLDLVSFPLLAIPGFRGG